MTNKNTIECDLISQRTRRRSKLDQYRTEIETLLADGSTQKSIAKRFGTSEVNLGKWMKSRGIKISQRTRQPNKTIQKKLSTKSELLEYVFDKGLDNIIEVIIIKMTSEKNLKNN